MERERLTRLLEDPSRMVREDLAGLEALARQYPWFSGARLLHAAGERLSGRVMADETLRVAAAHLPSRAALFDLANQVADPKQAPLRVVRSTSESLRLTAEVTPEPPKPSPMEVLAPPAEESQVEKIIESASRTEPEMGAGDSTVSERRGTGHIQPPELHQQKPFNLDPAEPADHASAPVPVETPTIDTLAEEYVKTAISQAYDLTWQQGLPAPVQPVTPSGLKETVAQDARLRFSDWLAASEAPLGTVVPLPVRDGATAKSPMSDAKGLDAKALIERFIGQQPPAIPPKPSFFTPQQAARKSLDDTTGIVTETLARIYAEQGNVLKAQETYERLALKYPDKSTYFAALSQALKDQLNP